MANSSKPLDLSLLFLAVCLFGLPGEATAAAHTSTYVFVPDQSKVVQTGGIAYVHWTYSIKGHFQLKVDPGAGTASFTHVDANATDDSPFKRTLDPNHVFNMTSLVGTFERSGSIKFTGKAPDYSDVNITVTFQDGLAHLIGQTTPPPNSADFFIFSLDAVARLPKYSGGSGTADYPYQIATAEDLIALGETPADYDKHFILTRDIDLDPNLPGGKVFDEAVITFFTGVFDGNGHTISHLTIIGARYTVGLFGVLNRSGYDVLDHGTEVKNLGVVDVNITGSGDCVGGLVGDNYYGTVTQCYSTGAASGTGQDVGGLVGSRWFTAGVRDSFWDFQTSGQTTSAGGTGKTTAEMQTASTFLEAGWDFVNIWGIGQNQTYPYLRKYSAADINQDASVNFLDLAALAENWLTGGEP